MQKVIDKLENFDISYKKSVLLLILIIGSWAGYSAYDELNFPYEDCGSFGKRGDMGIGICTDYGMRLMYMMDYEEKYRFNNPLRVVTFELLHLSDQIFGDFRIVPFISSGFVIALTFFITKQITNRHYTGLVAVLFLLHSPIFYKYDLVMTYPNFWVSFLLGSIYFSMRSWPLSPVLFFLGLPAKIINVLNLPVVLCFVGFSDLKQKKKIMISYIAVIGVAVGALFATKFLYTPIWYRFYSIFLSQIKFQPEEFLWWLGMWSVELFTDKISLFMIFILLPCLFMLKKRNVKYAGAMLAVILITMLQPAFISGFTEYTNEDYRFLHMIVFISISIGLIIPNTKKMLQGFKHYFNIGDFK